MILILDRLQLGFTSEELRLYRVQETAGLQLLWYL